VVATLSIPIKEVYGIGKLSLLFTLEGIDGMGSERLSHTFLFVEMSGVRFLYHRIPGVSICNVSYGAGDPTCA
jgi:hypothetical protein